MPDVLTIREAVQRAKAEGLQLSEYSLRYFIRSGAIPTRKVGQKALVYYPNIIKFIRCDDGCDNQPASVATLHGIRRVDL